MADTACTCEACATLRAWGELSLRADTPMSDAEDREWRMDLGEVMRSAAALARRIALADRLASAAAGAEPERPDAAGLYHGRHNVEPPGARAARSVRAPGVEAVRVAPLPALPAAEKRLDRK